MKLPCVAALFLGVIFGLPAAAQFNTTCNTPGNPSVPCNNTTTSLGMVQIKVNDAFVSLFRNVPGFNAATGILASPILYDNSTTIGRSAVFKDGSTSDVTGVLVGAAAGNMAGERNLIFSSSITRPPAGTDELLNDIYSLTLKNSAGTFTVSAGAFNGPRSNALHSYGTMQSNSGNSNNPAADFPATLLFDAFVTAEISIGPRMVKLANFTPLILSNGNATALPPRAISTTDGTTWTPLFFTDAYPGVWNAGDCAGFIVQAGLATGFTAAGTDASGNWTGPDVATFAQFMAQQPASTNNTITVTRVDDPQGTHTGISLRDAITTGNAGTGGQTILFPSSLFIDNQQVINVQSPLPPITAFDVNLLVAPGGNALSIGGGLGFPAFQVGSVGNSSPNHVGFFGFTIDDQDSSTGPAAGIAAANADLFLGNMVVRDNLNQSQSGNGGGVSLLSGQLFVSLSNIHDNGAKGNGAGVFVSQGVLTMTDSLVHDNASSQGGGIYTTGSEVTLTRVNVGDNHAQLSGGGVFLDQGSVFRITSSTIDFNGGGSLGSAFVAGAATSGVLAWNTIYSNGPPGAVSLSNPAAVTVVGNLIAGNTPPPTNFGAPANNLIVDSATGAKLTEEAFNDNTYFYLLGAGSTAINACTPVAGITPVLDQAGNLFPATPTVSCGSVLSTVTPATLANPVGSNQSAAVNSVFPFPLQVTLLDPNGNVIPNQGVTFTAPSGGPTGTFATRLGSANSIPAVTDIHGVATATAFTANSSTGSYMVTVTSPGVNTPVNFSLTNALPTVNVTLQTSPAGLLVGLDGGPFASAPVTVPLTIGSTHTIATQATQAGGAGTQYVWQSWSGGVTSVSGGITVPATDTTYTATFKTLYQLNVSASPAAGGTLTILTLQGTNGANGQFWDAGVVLGVEESTANNYQFANWSGSVNSTVTPEISVTMNSPQNITANFVQVFSITVDTAPTGLQFTVDGGAPQTGPKGFSFVAGSQHTIAAASTQNGTPGAQYVFGSWSDGGAISHTITVTESEAFTATYQTQYQLTAAASPAAGGTVTPSTGSFYASGTSVPIRATANSEYQFSNWTGSVASASSASTTVTMSAPETVTANFSSLTGITVQTSPQGLQFAVDGGAVQTAPQTLNLLPGSHTIAVVTTQAGPTGTQYVFSSWSDSGASSHSITVGSSAATFTATFQTQFQLTISASPATGGTVTPPTGGYYNSGASVPITATASNGFQFANWTGSVASASSTSTTVTMSAPETVTANFSSLTGITIQTAPPGLQFTVDSGAVQTAPQTLSLLPGSHTIAVTATQAGPTGTQYVFSSWSDNGAASHSITVGSAAATYIATFQTQFQLTISASPAGGGTVTPATGGYYNSGASVPITATANNGFQFANWTGSVASASSTSTTVTMSAPETVTANFSSVTGITIQTAPPGLQFTVDSGAVQTAPQTLNLSAGSHTITVVTTQAGPTGTQYVFSSWSDNGAASHSITLGSAAATYTATFQTQFQLTISASPAAGGTATPATGNFYNSGASVPIGATPNSGFQFSNWTGNVASASSASTTVTMSAPETVTANFSSPTGITIQTSPAGLQFTVDGGPAQTAPQNLTLTQGPHAIAVAATQAGGAGTQYVFSSWSDNGAVSHGITVGSAAATYTATFQTQFQLTISASPAAGGTVTPATGGYYNSGASVPITATANNGFQFANWTGSVASASSTSTTVTMSSPETVTANITRATTSGLAFYSVTPCRVADTRNANGPFGGPIMPSGSTRSFTITASSCHVPSNAQAYSLNITVAPPGPLGYLTIWPTGQTQPLVSTLNAFDGAVVANAAIVPAGTNGQVSVYVSDATDVIIDINGYFAPPNASALAFYPATPCRVADTRGANGPFGGPILSAGQTRNFAIPASACGIPSTAQAYSLNMTAVPPGQLIYLSTWPAGQTQPVVSTLNAFDGRVAANAAIVPAGQNGAISVFVSDPSNVIIDVNGYFAPPGSPGALWFYPATPCRIADTRGGSGFTGQFGPPMPAGNASRDFPITASGCGLPSTAQAYSLNMTVVPPGPLSYLTTWPAGQPQPVVSTLNSFQGKVVANAAIVPAGQGGAISVFVSDATQLIIDVNGYFAQ